MLSKYPKYIAVVNEDGKRTSHMEFSKEGKEYRTFGWSLPVKYIESKEGILFIENFMEHLNKNKLEPISKSTYEKDKWGIKANFKFDWRNDVK